MAPSTLYCVEGCEIQRACLGSLRHNRNRVLLRLPVLRCLLVEDQLMLQEPLAEMLARQPGLLLVGAATTAGGAIKACSDLHPDLLILDLALPDGDGLLVARAFALLNPQGRVIVLSSFASNFERPQDLRDSIIAILDKTRAFQDLLEAIAPLLPSPVAASIPLDLSTLTERELAVLWGLGQGLSSQAIAEQLMIAVRTVGTHRQNIAGKLGLSGAALVHQATLLAREGRLKPTHP